ncbi:MAG: acyl-CoA/acyl-ACP dehydrogenase [Sphingobacteriales bacterium]|jgi:alkylation response protein AidB-like acyl-CoA dehydrogenase|nr:acyl-CoA/acyl-ACP dehydrogenase [Sphingobacteriales bacterium]
MSTKNKKDFPLAAYFSYYNQFLDSRIGKAFNLRKISERFVYEGIKNGVKAANSTSRVFKNLTIGNAKRLESKPESDLFDLNYTEEQSIIRESVQAFAIKMRAEAEKIDEAGVISDELWQEFNALQLAYMQVPEDLGGMMKQKSTVTQMMMVETLAHGDLGQALALFTKHSVLNAIIQWGTAEQQEALVPDFLNEQPEIATIAVNEPTPLFSPFELNTTAVNKEDEFVLNGIKNMVPLAAESAFFLVAAQTENFGIQLFIVDKEANGVKITSDRSMGLNAAELGEIHLDNVLVDESAMLGGSKGLNYPEFIAYSKLGWCSLAVGCCQAVLDYVIPYTNDRYAFGEPISHRQAVAFMIADIKIELDSMRMLTQRAASRAEQGLKFEREAYLAHILCSDKSMQIGSNGVQLLGGHGYIRDFPVERWYRDLRAVSIGLNGVHL